MPQINGSYFTGLSALRRLEIEESNMSNSKDDISKDRHQSLKHVKSMQFPCDNCDYKATQRSNLLRHVQAKHDGVKFPCDNCDYKATQSSNLLRHIKSKHETVKVHCERSDYKATNIGSLIKHLKSKNEGNTKDDSAKIKKLIVKFSHAGFRFQKEISDEDFVPVSDQDDDDDDDELEVIGETNSLKRKNYDWDAAPQHKASKLAFACVNFVAEHFLL